MLQKLRNNKEGFTLIELMIVIAIIGILAAIAIPNFIAYRDKAFCSAAESDMQTVMGAIADYFSDPDNTSVQTTSLTGLNMSGDNSFAIEAEDDGYRVTITDASERCPRWDDHTISKLM